MQVRRKIFPYPILNNDKLYSNYADAFFEITYETAEDESAYTLTGLHFTTNSELINKLFDENKIAIKLIIECSETVYRKAFDISKTPRNIILRKVDFSEKVEVSMFACASQNFIMSSDEFDDDYKGIGFEIEKYDIICANDGFSINFRHDESEGNLVKSIFSISPREDMEESIFEVDCTGSKKIVISLSKKDHENIKIVNTLPEYKEVVFNMLLTPALIQALTLCVKDADNLDIDDLGNKYRWFRSIVSSYLRLTGKELTIEELKNTSPILLAQRLLGKPIGEALNKMVQALNGTEGEI